MSDIFDDLVGKKIVLTNIDGLYEQNNIKGKIVSFISPEICRIKLGQELEVKGKLITELTIFSRHKGYPLTNLRKRKFFMFRPIIAVNVQGVKAEINFIAEIELI